MNLLFDENLSATLVRRLADVYRDAQHVTGVGLGSADDAAIWNYARTHDLAIVSKDSDFAERSVLESAPPKVIWIRAGNCSTSAIERQLLSAREIVWTFLDEDSETCLILDRL